MSFANLLVLAVEWFVRQEIGLVDCLVCVSAPLIIKDGSAQTNVGAATLSLKF